jgi:Domain of unknown function (DUF4082)
MRWSWERKFQPVASGTVTGVRFYKSAANTGTHAGSLWSSSGKLLGRVTFSGETASGWQQMSFSTAVAVAANTTYVISYHTNTGRYSDDDNFFTASITNSTGTLTALKDGSSGRPARRIRPSRHQPR